MWFRLYEIHEDQHPAGRFTSNFDGAQQMKIKQFELNHGHLNGAVAPSGGPINIQYMAAQLRQKGRANITDRSFGVLIPEMEL